MSRFKLKAAASCRAQFATAFAYAHSVYQNKTYADRGVKLPHPIRDCDRLRSLCLFKQNIRRSRRQAAAPSSRLRSLTLTLFIQTKHTPIAAASCRTQFATAFAYAHSVYQNKTYADRGGKLPFPDHSGFVYAYNNFLIHKIL